MIISIFIYTNEISGLIIQNKYHSIGFLRLYAYFISYNVSLFS